VNENTKIIISIFCIFFALFLIGAGLLMHKYDFSSMFRPAFVKTDGLYIRCGFKFKRIADDTPENRIKFSKLLGNTSPFSVRFGLL